MWKMEHILSASIVRNVYAYMHYSDLQRYKYVPDSIWKDMHDYFCTDIDFKNKIYDFWGKVIHTSYRQRLLNFIKFHIVHSSYIPQILLDNRDFILDCVNNNRDTYIVLKTKYITDFEIMLRACRRNPYLMTNVKNELKQDTKWVLAAINSNVFCLVFVGSEVQCNSEIICAVAHKLEVVGTDVKELYIRCIAALIENYGEYYSSLDYELRHNKNILDALKKYKHKRSHSDEEKYIEMYKRNSSYETALMAIKHGMFLQNVHAGWLNDKNFIRAALESSPYYKRSNVRNFGYSWHVLPVDGFGDELKKDSAFILELLTNDEYLFPDRPDPPLDSNHEIQFKILQRTPRQLHNKRELQENTGFIRRLLAYDMSLIGFIRSDLKNNVEWVSGVFGGRQE